MAATTVAIDTPEIPKSPVDFELPIKTGAVLKTGAMANVDANGEAVDAGDTAAQRCAGRVQSINDAGTKAIIRKSIFRYGNVGSLTNASIGAQCFVKTNQEVCPTGSSTNKVEAGRIHLVDANGVWVDFHHAGNYTNP